VKDFPVGHFGLTFPANDGQANMAITRAMFRLYGTALTAVTLSCSDDDPTGNTGALDLTVDPGAIAVAQGASGSVTVSLTRSPGFTNPASLSVSGLPAGVTTVITPEDLEGATVSAAIGITIGPAVTPGTYTALVTATADGAASATVSWQLTVTPLGTIQYLFCDVGSAPTFAAFQDGSGVWQRVTGTDTPQGTRFTITLTQPSGGVLFVHKDQQALRGPTPYLDQLRSSHQRSGIALSERSVRAGEYLTEVLFGSVAELAEDAAATCQETGLTREVTATVNGIPAGSYGIVSLGGNTTILDGAAAGNGISFPEVPLRLLDLVGTRATPGMAPDKMILRRNIDLENSNVLEEPIDFNASAAITPVTALATITGGNGDQLEIFTDIILSSGQAGLWFDLAPSPNAARTWAGLPQSALETGDYHALVVFATPEGTGDFRVSLRYVGIVINQTLALGPSMPQTLSQALGTGPYPRYRFQGTIPPEYGRGLSLEVAGADGSGNQLSILATKTWLAANGGADAYDIAMPDVASLAGFPAAARLTVGENVVSVSGFGFTGPGIFDPRPTLGREFKAAVKSAVINVP